MIRQLLAILLLSAISSLFIREISDDELSNFITYKSSAIISPFKSEERIESRELRNYLPVKITLVNSPEIKLLSADSPHAKKLAEAEDPSNHVSSAHHSLPTSSSVFRRKSKK